MLVEKIKVALVVSQFHEQVTQQLYTSAMRRLDEYQVEMTKNDIMWVPGAVEIPLIAQQYAQSSRYDSVICLGAVIRGQTNHYDYVCDMVSRGCQSVSLAHNIPVVFGILTTENKAQAMARAGGDHSNQGYEAVETAVRMVKSMRCLSHYLSTEEVV